MSTSLTFTQKINHAKLAARFIPDLNVRAAAMPYIRELVNPGGGCTGRLHYTSNAAKDIFTGQLPIMRTGKSMGNHYHSAFSWGLGGFHGFPALIALLSKVTGQSVTGLVDHYSLDGADEFRQASAMLDIPCTTGFEIRAWIREKTMCGGFDLSQTVINSPGNTGEVYIVFHGVTGSRSVFLDRAVTEKDHRYMLMADKLKEFLISKGLTVELNWSRILDRTVSGRNVLDKHLTAVLFDELYSAFGDNDSAFDRIIAGIQEATGKALSGGDAQKLARAKGLEDEDERNYQLFTVITDIMRARFLRAGTPGFIMPGVNECPPMEALAGIARADKAILTYPILLKSGGRTDDDYEDDYFDPLMDRLFGEWGFHAASWMPNRNKPEESQMIRDKLAARQRPSISGMDVNKYLQNWLEQASYDPWLVMTAFALVGHEISVRKMGRGMPDVISAGKVGYPHYLEHLFAGIGKRAYLTSKDPALIRRSD